MSRALPAAFCALLIVPCLPAGAGSYRHHHAGFAPIDGDRDHRGTNRAGEPLRRALASDYADGVDALAGPDRPSARAISNAVFAQGVGSGSYEGASDYLWQWGQFLDHDIDLTEAADPSEPADIPVPTGDPYFDPFGLGNEVIPLDRSVHDGGAPREQHNGITGWIDASNVYGSDDVRAAALRTNDGSGRLATSPGHLLPKNVDGLPNAGGPGADLFLAGDVRANEQIGLTAMHTLFVREHNRLVRRLSRRHPRWSGERLYQQARRIVIAQMQVITYREFLPALLGAKALPRYRGYRHTDPRITNVFSTAAYRFGHSALSPRILRVGADGTSIPEGPLALRDAFFNPDLLAQKGDLDPILRGLAQQVCQRVDASVVDDVRNFLFGPPGAGGFDLVSLNIQRGRDHGLPSYNAARVAYGLPAAADFSDVTPDPEMQARLASVYDDVDAIDLWVGGLAEKPVHDSHVGPLFQRILVDQFTALRDGDRHYWERRFFGRDRRALARLRLSHVIRRNTGIGRELPEDVFHVH